MADILRREAYGKGSRPVIRCSCGKEVFCTEFTNTCACGIDYNSGGQELAPRAQWGEETGEHWADCIGPFTGDELDDGGW